MKKLTLSLCLCLFMLSCKKELPAPPATSKKYAVTFKASDFSQEVTKFSKRNSISDVPLKGMAAYFAYIVYDSNGNEINQMRQDSTGNTTLYSEEEGYWPLPIGNCDYGTIKDSLPSGTYTIVMIATNNILSINYRADELDYFFKPLPEAFFQYRRGLSPLTPRAKDTFFKKFTLIVGQTNIEQSITLERIVAKSEINILDAQPGMDFSIEYDDHEGFKFDSEESIIGTSYDDLQYYIPDPAPVYNSPLGAKFSKILLNTSRPMTIRIKHGDLIKVIENVQFYKNKRTILTGNFFSTNPTKVGFTVTVNDEFETDPVEISF